MEIVDIKNRIHSFSGELYSFANSLLPDDLQAQQLVIDALSFLFADKDSKEMIYGLLETNEVEFSNTEFYALKKMAIKVVYGLAKRRYAQIQRVLSPDHYEAYYNLALEQRAVLFLHHKLGFSADEISEIVSFSRIEVLTKLFEARQDLNELSAGV